MRGGVFWDDFVVYEIDEIVIVVECVWGDGLNVFGRGGFGDAG